MQVAFLHLFALAVGGFPSGFAAGFETISQADLQKDVRALASPVLEGRDTPSLGLERAAELIEERFAAAGLVFAPDSAQVWTAMGGAGQPGSSGGSEGGSATGAEAGTTVAGTYRRPFRRQLEEPDPALCALSTPRQETASGRPLELEPRFELGRHFAPVSGFAGEAEGELVFAGYGIRSGREKYYDFEGSELRGRIALIVEGEPRHERRFDGHELGPSASLWEKIDALAEAGAVGVLVARRAPERYRHKGSKAPPAKPGADEPQLDGFSFRYTWADFNGVPSDPLPSKRIPALEVSMSAAAGLLGQDVEALAAKIDANVRPVKLPRAKGTARHVRMRSGTRHAQVRIDNVVGLLRGNDPALADEYVVVGAHYDHVGTDPRGRIACGADDNASGVAAVLEIAEALATALPRRSVFLVAFAGEEDGLLGSAAFCERPPVALEKIVAMVNLDMIGRGDPAEVAAIGIVQNPALEKVLNRAQTLKPCGVREVVVRQGEELFTRSDHYSFHRVGVPVLFVFEGLPIEKNADYHTWRDTLDKLDLPKMLNTTRLVYNATWILTNDDARPPPPRG